MTAATPIRLTFPQDVADFEKENRVPAPKYRHAAPSAPWPWMDFDQDRHDVSGKSTTLDPDKPWSGYPQSRFGNWTPDQVDRCQMKTICKDNYECQIHKVDVAEDGKFIKLSAEEVTDKIPSDLSVVKTFWEAVKHLSEPSGSSDLRLRALFIESITLDVLQVLGEIYDIEPFFFASSANWIPSRYQENPIRGEGDHITVVLPFIRAVNNDQRGRETPTSGLTDYSTEKAGKAALTDTKHTIDTQAPLVLSDKKILLQDLLAIHMVRRRDVSLIISYHHHSGFQKTTAKHLQSLVQRTGDSVYWQKIYAKSKDPTFVFLAVLWYALYAWDEALETLYGTLSEQLEAKPTNRGDDPEGREPGDRHTAHTRELHKLQAHILYYQQLLRDFKKSVEFVRDTDNPAMDDLWSAEERQSSKALMTLETGNLLSEIARLENQRKIQSDRLENAMRLAFSTVNIEDSKSMQKLTLATMRDSAAMKQISYLTMIFLPASFLASVFGMNVREINPGTLESLTTYIESTVILTLITAWVVIALQEHSSFHQGGTHYVERVLWPAYYGLRKMKDMMPKNGGRAEDRRGSEARGM